MSVRAPKSPGRAIVTPSRTAAIFRPKVFAELAQGDPRVLNQLVNGFEKAIAKSFKTNPPPSGRPTANMVRERFVICEKWFRELRGAKQWGTSRILDTLHEILRAELNGQTWQPDERACWMPGDGH